MTSPLPRLVGLTWHWMEAASLRASVAILASIFLMTGAARGTEAPIIQTAFTERVLPAAPPVTNATENEPLQEPAAAEPAETRSDDDRITDPGTVASHAMPSSAPTPDPEMGEVNQYLWAVYQRTTVKSDGSGDFTWKDVAAAARLGMTLGDYVIGGMDRDIRELLYRAGLAMDAAGFRWSILSAFRDDYRQGLASGYKARTGDSLHGGSFTTGGYGHGCAVDIVDADGKSRILWTWLDANSAQLGFERPLPGIDPAHVQPRGPWHEIATMLRHDRLAKGEPPEDAAAVAEPVDISSTPPSEADMKCIGLHHRQLMQAAATT